MKNIFVALVILMLVLSQYMLYMQGLREGEQRYKASHKMYMALKSAYMFGWYDGHVGKPNDWDGINR